MPAGLGWRDHPTEQFFRAAGEMRWVVEEVADSKQVPGPPGAASRDLAPSDPPFHSGWTAGGAQVREGTIGENAPNFLEPWLDTKEQMSPHRDFRGSPAIWTHHSNRREVRPDALGSL
ncbi:hypothetical protein NDU88_001333 [Pleurodeles waltl]|uniref:Uncharacterized protein n=1 Tax=Pleurodeles waltl TaxID=8319 RepID=A0AAV7VWL3_PLEWA|nr:hypothetical protein NDU88_001333 [Pleurodeles waltl]